MKKSRLGGIFFLKYGLYQPVGTFWRINESFYVPRSYEIIEFFGLSFDEKRIYNAEFDLHLFGSEL